MHRKSLVPLRLRHGPWRATYLCSGTSSRRSPQQNEISKACRVFDRSIPRAEFRSFRQTGESQTYHPNRLRRVCCFTYRGTAVASVPKDQAAAKWRDRVLFDIRKFGRSRAVDFELGKPRPSIGTSRAKRTDRKDRGCAKRNESH